MSYHATFKYDNGYGASVVSDEYTYGGKSGLFELGVLHGERGWLCYSSEVTDDVLGYLTEHEVAIHLTHIESLPTNELCSHKRRETT